MFNVQFVVLLQRNLNRHERIDTKNYRLHEGL